MRGATTSAPRDAGGSGSCCFGRFCKLALTGMIYPIIIFFKSGLLWSKTVNRPTPLTPVDAHAAIQKLLAEYDSIGITDHARERCIERNVTVDYIRNVLMTGSVAPAEWDTKRSRWRYCVTGLDCERDPLA